MISSATDLRTIGVWGGNDDAQSVLQNLTCIQTAVKSLRDNGIFIRERTVVKHQRVNCLAVGEYDCTEAGRAE
eukprot:1023634-Rhodomonas_salina.1